MVLQLYQQCSYSKAVKPLITSLRARTDYQADIMSASIQAMEHRWGNRMELHAPALVQTPTGSIAHGSVRNASISGAFVETLLQLPLLSRVLLRPDCDAGEWLEACVVRVETDGAALEWLDPPLQAVSALLALRSNPPAAAANDSAVIAPNFVSWQLDKASGRC
jgi:hypothetical protein